MVKAKIHNMKRRKNTLKLYTLVIENQGLVMNLLCDVYIISLTLKIITMSKNRRRKPIKFYY